VLKRSWAGEVRNVSVLGRSAWLRAAFARYWASPRGSKEDVGKVYTWIA